MDYDWIIDGGYLPYSVLRLCTRQLLRLRRAAARKKSFTAAIEEKSDFVARLKTLPIAIETTAANEQQYEVSTGVFAAFLGPRMKYSCSRFPTGNETLAQAETATLKEYASKAEIQDGMSILDLGCGWGSATLCFAEMFPASRVTGFSNSSTQKEFIDAEAAKRNLKNVEIITGNIAHYEFESQQFDRVVSIELFEHMKNYELLMAKIAACMKPKGKLFVQVLCHRDTPYDFDEGWMSRYFFTGGTMMSADLLLYFQQDLKIQKQWWVSGVHYSRTLEAWFSALMANKSQVWPFLVDTYGKGQAQIWYNRWMVYHLAGSEHFAQANGDDSGIAHYLFEKS